MPLSRWRSVSPRGLELGEPRQEIVALDVRDRAPRTPSRVASCVELGGEPGGVEAAGVDDDPDAALDAGAEHLLDLREEGARVAGVRVLQRDPWQRIISVSSAR